MLLSQDQHKDIVVFLGQLILSGVRPTHRISTTELDNSVSVVNKTTTLKTKTKTSIHKTKTKTLASKTKTKTETEAPKHKRNVNIIESQIKAVMYHE